MSGVRPTAAHTMRSLIQPCSRIQIECEARKEAELFKHVGGSESRKPTSAVASLRTAGGHLHGGGCGGHGGGGDPHQARRPVEVERPGARHGCVSVRQKWKSEKQKHTLSGLSNWDVSKVEEFDSSNPLDRKKHM